MCHTLLINREGQRENSLYSHCQSLTQNLCSATKAVPLLGPYVLATAGRSNGVGTAEEAVLFFL